MSLSIFGHLIGHSRHAVSVRCPRNVHRFGCKTLNGRRSADRVVTLRLRDVNRLIVAEMDIRNSVSQCSVIIADPSFLYLNVCHSAAL